MPQFPGVTVTVVENGTEVGKDQDGNAMIVTDQNAIFKGAKAWVTQRVFDKIKEVSK